jgi:glutamate-1-semialdehyde aminotransferase
LGPQTPLAGEVAKLLCDLTGNERMTFCNTGSDQDRHMLVLTAHHIVCDG